MGVGTWLIWISVAVCILTFVGSIVGGFYVNTAVMPTYTRAVSSHLDNAYELNSPEQMLEEVELAEQGMKDLGLHENMYTQFWSWDQIPSNSMKFQYTYMKGLKERIQSVIDWKANTYGKNNTSESMGDVYEQKMINLRKFIMENADGSHSRSDWIAKDAWYYNMHTGWYWLGYFEEIIFLITSVISGLGLVWLSERGY